MPSENYRDPHSSPSAPPVRAIATLVMLDVLLMVFSVVLWQLNNDTLAATAGAGAIALTVDIARRLLATTALSTVDVVDPARPFPISAQLPPALPTRPADADVPKDGRDDDTTSGTVKPAA